MEAHLTFPFRVFGFVVGFAVTLRFFRCRMHATLPRLTATLPDGWSRHACHRGGHFASILPCDGTFFGTQESASNFLGSLLDLCQRLCGETLVAEGFFG